MLTPLRDGFEKITLVSVLTGLPRDMLLFSYQPGTQWPPRQDPGQPGYRLAAGSIHMMQTCSMQELRAHGGVRDEVVCGGLEP